MTLLNVVQAAERLNISEQMVRRLVADGSLGHVRIGDRVLLRPADLIEFVEARVSRRSKTKVA